MTNELEKRIKELKERSWTKECTNGLLKEILIELIVLNSQVRTLFGEEIFTK